MRVGTLFDADTEAFLSRHFVLAAHNQLPQLYCGDGTIDATADSAYSRRHMAVVTEGAAGGNVRSYFCTPRGRLVHYVGGYWKPRRYQQAARWALERMAAEKPALVAAHQESSRDLTRQRDAILPPEQANRLAARAAGKPATPSGPSQSENGALRQVRAFNRLIRSHKEAVSNLGRPIAPLLKEVENNAYLKGALGCDS